MTDAAGPELSVVLVGDEYATVREMIARLGEQTVRDDLEVVVVLPDGAGAVEASPDLERLGGVRVVRVESIDPLGPARALGVREASAPAVLLAETHAFPEAPFGQIVIAAHRAGAAAVAPAIGNANPQTARSWAAYLQDYGRLLEPEAGAVDAMPSYNCSFERERLLAFGAGLAELLEPTDALSQSLRRSGARLVAEPAALILHLNVSSWWPWAAERYLHGRIVAGARSRVWGWARRLLYAGSTPLVPLVLLARIRPHLARARRRGLAPRRTLWLLVLGVSISALGELAGYVAGEGDAARRMLRYELHKRRYAPDRG